MDRVKRFIGKVGLGDVLTVAIIGVVLAGVYGCSASDFGLSDSKKAAVNETVEKFDAMAKATPEVLRTAEPIINAVEGIPGYDGIQEETATRVEAGLKTTDKNLGYAKAGLTIAKAAVPGAAVYVDPALKIITGISVVVGSLYGFVQKRKRKTAEKVSTVIMKAVDPIKGVGAMIADAADKAEVKDETHALYRKNVEA